MCIWLHIWDSCGSVDFWTCRAGVSGDVVITGRGWFLGENPVPRIGVEPNPWHRDVSQWETNDVSCFILLGVRRVECFFHTVAQGHAVRSCLTLIRPR